MDEYKEKRRPFLIQKLSELVKNGKKEIILDWNGSPTAIYDALDIHDWSQLYIMGLVERDVIARKHNNYLVYTPKESVLKMIGKSD